MEHDQKNPSWEDCSTNTERRKIYCSARRKKLLAPLCIGMGRGGGGTGNQRSGAEIRNTTSQGHKQWQLKPVYDCLKEQVLHSCDQHTTPKKGWKVQCIPGYRICSIPLKEGFGTKRQ